MSADQRFGLIIALLTLLFAVLSAALGLLVRAAVRWTKVEDRLADMTQDLTRHIEQSDQVHREDRAATNARLTYLERNVWPRASGHTS